MTDDVVAGQVGYYRERAGEYDATAYGDVAAARERIARVVGALAPRGRVLEIACGTGLWTAALAEVADSVLAIDAAPEVVAIARDRLPAGNVTFQVADVFSWTTEETFDVIFFSAWLSHVPSSRFDEFWGIVRRWLAPGGRVLFIDEHVDERGKETYLPGDGEIVQRRLGDGRTFRVVKNFVDPAALTERLRGIGWSCEIRREGADWIRGDARIAADRRALGRVFNEVPELYDRVRPGYPAELFADLARITGLHGGSSVLEIGCGTGQATRPLAELGVPVTALEPGPELASVARQRLAGYDRVTVQTSRFEEWDDRGARFDVLVAASAWHWVDPAVGWPRAYELLRPGGWVALLGNVVVRRPGEPEAYAETADLHERFAPGNPDWGHPPWEAEARTTGAGWGEVADPGAGFTPPIVCWYPTVQWLDGAGLADLLRTNSPYRRLAPDVREPLLAAVAERIRTRLGDRVPRRYLSVLRVGQRTDVKPTGSSAR